MEIFFFTAFTLGHRKNKQKLFINWRSCEITSFGIFSVPLKCQRWCRVHMLVALSSLSHLTGRVLDTELVTVIYKVSICTTVVGRFSTVPFFATVEGLKQRLPPFLQRVPGHAADEFRFEEHKIKCTSVTLWLGRNKGWRRDVTTIDKCELRNVLIFVAFLSSTWPSAPPNITSVCGIHVFFPPKWLQLHPAVAG